MDPDGSPPFKAAASNPMLGYEADEWQLLHHDTTDAMLETQPISPFTYGAQEFSQGSTIDPSLLSNPEYTTHTPPGIGVQMDLLMDIDTNTPNGASQMEYQARASNDLNAEEDQASGFYSTSPNSSSMSDFSEFSCENDIDGGALSEPPATGTSAGPLPSSGAGMDSAPSASGSPRHRHLGKHTKPLKCPKAPEGCTYRAQFNKEIEKHIWSRHVKWAEETNRTPIRKECKICGVILERPDNVKRHMDEVHGKVKRKRGPGG
ncbi:hypothetical protein HDV57DRAFT_511651 [Trichoderma longibrachiatum]|uniref:C2H2-type domain-containing protein n=1 Tax=Trichoderma longibrachiatum ATCC 18648 TaxID=983965 RepID=A0A2T4BP86_TRILO|nr:hypothetical protein M440DRAFT_1344898 [Trichoderma longibrachiatum ATCC 18648]